MKEDRVIKIDLCMAVVSAVLFFITASLLMYIIYTSKKQDKWSEEIERGKDTRTEWYQNEVFLQILDSTKNESKGLYAEYTFSGDSKNIEEKIDAFFTLAGELKKPIAVISSPPPDAGGHWVFMYFIDKDNLLYVDPYGTKNFNIKQIAKNLKKNLYISITRTQTDGHSCGPLSTELARHFQGMFFREERIQMLLNELVFMTKDQQGFERNVDITFIQSEMIKEYRREGTSDTIRATHNSLKEDGETVEIGGLIIEIVGLIVEKKKYYNITEEEKNKKLEDAKQRILTNIANMETIFTHSQDSLDKLEILRCFVDANVKHQDLTQVFTKIKSSNNDPWKKDCDSVNEAILEIKYLADIENSEYDQKMAMLRQKIEEMEASAVRTGLDSTTAASSGALAPDVQ